MKQTIKINKNEYLKLIQGARFIKGEKDPKKFDSKILDLYWTKNWLLLKISLLLGILLCIAKKPIAVHHKVVGFYQKKTHLYIVRSINSATTLISELMPDTHSEAVDTLSPINIDFPSHLRTLTSLNLNFILIKNIFSFRFLYWGFIG